MPETTKISTGVIDKMIRSWLKTKIQKALARFGFEIQKIRPKTVPINILPGVIRDRMATRKSTEPF